MANTTNKLGLVSLSALCIGSMIGGGIFALPQNVAYSTGVGALLIAWIITFVGMLSLALVFQNLSMRRPDLDAGVYAYAKEGLGKYLGFSSAWGYWISAWIGNIGFVIIFCSALSLFFPVFGDGNNTASLIFNSIIIWAITLLCIRGIKSATIINTVTTFAKLIPIIIFIVIIAYAFKKTTFVHDVWLHKTLGSTLTQVKAMMLVTVWTFIGIEGASVFSARAQKRHDVGKATIIGFVIVFLMLFLVSALPYGIISQAQLANLKNPSTGALLAQVVGSWGNVLINIGLIISVLGALLAWILLAAEVPFIAGVRDQLFPKYFAKETKAKTPVGALIITAICQQIYLIIAHYNNAGYLSTILLATSMILVPYFFSAIFALQLVITGKTYENSDKNVWRKDAIVSTIAVIYGIWLLYASGIKYLLLSSILYLIGNIVFVINKWQRKLKLFDSRYEIILIILSSLLGLFCVYALKVGIISL